MFPFELQMLRHPLKDTILAAWPPVMMCGTSGVSSTVHPAAHLTRPLRCPLCMLLMQRPTCPCTVPLALPLTTQCPTPRNALRCPTCSTPHGFQTLPLMQHTARCRCAAPPAAHHWVAPGVHPLFTLLLARPSSLMQNTGAPTLSHQQHPSCCSCASPPFAALVTPYEGRWQEC